MKCSGWIRHEAVVWCKFMITSSLEKEREEPCFLAFVNFYGINTPAWSVSSDQYGIAECRIEKRYAWHNNI